MITMIIPDDYKCYLSELHALFKAHYDNNDNYDNDNNGHDNYR